jgi:hypothetical protein
MSHCLLSFAADIVVGLLGQGPDCQSDVFVVKPTLRAPK